MARKPKATVASSMGVAKQSAPSKAVNSSSIPM
jgi:hypothetical protein